MNTTLQRLEQGGIQFERKAEGPMSLGRQTPGVFGEGRRGLVQWAAMEENFDNQGEGGDEAQAVRPPVPTSAPPPTPNAEPLAPTKPGLTELLVPFVIMAVVLVLDQYTKRVVEANIPLYSYWAPVPSLENIFRITHVANTGGVFGLFQGTGTFFAALAIVVVAVIVYFNFTLPGKSRLLRTALGLQLGGGLGNMIDRFRLGHVTDFIDIGPWYIFNVADMALVSGIILFAVYIIREERQQKQAEAETAVLHPVDSQE